MADRQQSNYLSEIYKPPSDSGRVQPALPEFPNQMIEVKLLLKRLINDTVLLALATDFREHNMSKEFFHQSVANMPSSSIFSRLPSSPQMRIYKRISKSDRVEQDPDSNTNIIVTGIPSANGFDKHIALSIAKRQEPEATLISFRTLC